MLRIAAEHRAGVVADGFYRAGSGVERDERRFTDDDPAAPREDAGAGRSDIDGEVGRKSKRHKGDDRDRKGRSASAIGHRNGKALEILWAVHRAAPRNGGLLTKCVAR